MKKDKIEAFETEKEFVAEMFNVQYDSRLSVISMIGDKPVRYVCGGWWIYPSIKDRTVIQYYYDDISENEFDDMIDQLFRYSDEVCITPEEMNNIGLLADKYKNPTENEELLQQTFTDRNGKIVQSDLRYGLIYRKDPQD